MNHLRLGQNIVAWHLGAFGLFRFLTFVIHLVNVESVQAFFPEEDVNYSARFRPATGLMNLTTSVILLNGLVSCIDEFNNMVKA